MTPPEGYQHRTDIRVRLHDLDAFGHVNNARYLNYLEEGRLGYFEDVCGWDGKMGSLAVIVARVEIDFKAPIFLGEQIELYTRVSRLGNTSLTLDYLLYVVSRDGQRRDAATAKVIMVTFDYKQNKPVPIFSEWREAITAYEPGLSS